MASLAQISSKFTVVGAGVVVMVGYENQIAIYRFLILTPFVLVTLIAGHPQAAEAQEENGRLVERRHYQGPRLMVRV